MTTILTTTGISLYLNTKHEYNTSSPTDDQMRQYLRTKPEAASAEANSLLQIATQDDSLILFHTETPEAEKCASLLEDFFRDRNFKYIKLVKLQFQDDEKHIETYGLRNLVNSIIKEIDKAKRKKQDIIINATSGFKPEIGYSTMIGMLYQIPIKYMHEKFRRIVTFKPIALEWDISLFINYSWFFKLFDEESIPRKQEEVEHKLKNIAISDRESIEALLDPPDLNGDIYLSPMGEALQHKFKADVEEAKTAEWPPSVEGKSIEDKISSSLLGHKHHPTKKDLSICYKIAALDCVKEIIGGNYEPTTSTRIKPTDPEGAILLLWADNEKAQRLTIYTTAKGKAQTLKVIQKIKEMLGLE